MTWVLAAVLGAGAGAAPSQAPSLELALQRTLSAHGGVEALSRLKALRVRAHVASTSRSGQLGSVLRVFERPQRLRVEVGYPGELPELRILDGTKGWRAGAPVLAGDPRQLSMVLQALRIRLPLILDEQKAKLVDGGLVRRGDRTLRALVLPVEPGLTLTAEVDPDTGRIVRSVGQADAGPMGLLEFATAYDDYRAVQGVLMAFKEENFAMGRRAGDTFVDSVEVLAAAPAGSFAP